MLPALGITLEYKSLWRIPANLDIALPRLDLENERAHYFVDGVGAYNRDRHSDLQLSDVLTIQRVGEMTNEQVVRPLHW